MAEDLDRIGRARGAQERISCRVSGDDQRVDGGQDFRGHAGKAETADHRFLDRLGVAADAISHYDSVTQTYTVALPNYHDNPEVRAVFMGSMDYAIGDHDLKAGYQYMRESSGFPYTSTSGMRAVFRSGAPDSVNTYNTPNNSIALLWAETAGGPDKHAMRPLFRSRQRHT